MGKISILFLSVLFFLPYTFSQKDSSIAIQPVDNPISDSVRLNKIEKVLRYLPRVYSVIKTDYEWNTQTGKHRFVVRNARLGIRGDVIPIINYQMEMDLSDEGVFRVLSAFAVFKPYSDKQHTLRFWLGYQKPFFSSEYLRNPMRIFFATRSLVVSDMTAGIVDVGLIADYAFKNQIIPFDVAIGVFNGMGFKNKSFEIPNYTGRIRLYPFNGLSLTGEYYGGYNLDSNKLSMWGAECAYQNNSFFIEAEYFHRNINHIDTALTETRSGLLLETYYKFPINKTKCLHYISPTLRWDMLGSSYFKDVFIARLTAGVNFGMDHEFFKAEFRLNYEKCLKTNNPNINDMFIAEMVISI